MKRIKLKDVNGGDMVEIRGNGHKMSHTFEDPLYGDEIYNGLEKPEYRHIKIWRLDEDERALKALAG